MPNDRRARKLLALLERMNLGWLAEELRTFSETVSLPSASPEDVLQARFHTRLYSRPASDLAEKVARVGREDAVLPAYSDYFQYIRNRLSSLSAMLRASADLLEELAPEGTRFSFQISELSDEPNAVNLREAANEVDVLVRILSEPRREG